MHKIAFRSLSRRVSVTNQRGPRFSSILLTNNHAPPVHNHDIINPMNNPAIKTRQSRQSLETNHLMNHQQHCYYTDIDAKYLSTTRTGVVEYDPYPSQQKSFDYDDEMKDGPNGELLYKYSAKDGEVEWVEHDEMLLFKDSGPILGSKFAKPVFREENYYGPNIIRWEGIAVASDFRRGKELSIDDAWEIIQEKDAEQSVAVIGEKRGSYILLKNGRYGFYIKWGNFTVSLPTGEYINDSSKNITMDDAWSLLQEKRYSPNDMVVAKLGPKSKSQVYIKYGLNGLYIQWEKFHVPLPYEYYSDPEGVPLDKAWSLLGVEKDEQNAPIDSYFARDTITTQPSTAEKIHEFGEVKGNMLNLNKGNGLFVSWGEINAKVPNEYYDYVSGISRMDAWNFIQKKRRRVQSIEKRKVEREFESKQRLKYKGLKVAELKDILTQRRLKKVGKKDELLDCLVKNDLEELIAKRVTPINHDNQKEN